KGRRSLGELRNISVKEASGHIVCIWDDDDLYGKDRLQIQASVLIKKQLDVVLLERLLMWWPAKEILAILRRRAWEGSMMSWKSCTPDYPHVVRAEDTAIISHLRKTSRIGLLDRPSLYCYVVHSNNTCSEPHFEDMLRPSHRAAFSPHRLDYRVLSQLSRVLPFKEHICAQNILAKLEGHNTGPDSDADNLLIELNHVGYRRLASCLCGSGKRYKHCHGSYLTSTPIEGRHGLDHSELGRFRLGGFNVS